MKYNVMTVLNSDYFSFGKMFVNSFYDNIDLEELNKLYVFDTGLSEYDKQYLSVFPKIELVSTELKTKHKTLHDEDWRKNVYSKTSFLLKVVEQDRLPTVMVDSDCIFLSDFVDYISEDYDFIGCYREEQDVFSRYIASFFVVNSIENAKVFIEDWRNEIFMGTENHKESPALSRLIEKGIYKVGILKEDLISCTKPSAFKDASIIHLKSTEEYRTVLQRVNQPSIETLRNKYLTDVPIVVKEDKKIEEFKQVRIGQGESKLEEQLKLASKLQKLDPAKRALLLRKLNMG